MTNPIKLECVHRLPKRIRIGGHVRPPSIESVKTEGGVFWAVGSHVLLRSVDAIRWHDSSTNLRDEGDFYVSDVAAGPSGISAFVRNRNGLWGHLWNESESLWRPLFEIPSPTSEVLASWTDRGLIALSPNNDLETEVFRLGASTDEVQDPHVTVAGALVHFQMSWAGRGICATHHSVVTENSVDHEGSSVFVTSDYGSHWRETARVQAMLLCGASSEPRGVLAGGDEGAIVAVNEDGLEEGWCEEGGDIVAVDVSKTRRVAVIESDDEAPVQRLLVYDAPRWVRREIDCLGERVAGIKLLDGNEFILCTHRCVFLGRLEDTLSHFYVAQGKGSEGER